MTKVSQGNTAQDTKKFQLPRVFRKRQHKIADTEEPQSKKTAIPLVQCKMMNEMSQRIAKYLGRTYDDDAYVFEDRILRIRVTSNDIHVAIKTRDDGKTVKVPVFITLISASAPRLYRCGSWTDHVIDDLYPLAVRKAWDKSLDMQDPGAIEQPDVATTLIN